MSFFSIFSKQKTVKKQEITLRQYQVDTTNKAIDSLVRLGKSFLICLPAQTGKTFTFYNIVKTGNFITIFITPRKFITEQGANEAYNFFSKEEVGYINSDVTDVIMKRVGTSKLEQQVNGKKIIIADLETIISRVKSNPKLFRHIELIGIDEAHYKIERVNILRGLFKDAHHIGITATPFNAKGEYIDGWDVRWDKYNTKYMVENKFLAKTELYHVDVYDNKEYDRYLAECKNNGMSEKGLSIDLIENAKIATENIIKHNLASKIINKKGRALVYAGSIEQSERIVEEYRHKGINAYCVHSKVDNAFDIVGAFNNKEFNVLVSVSMLVMGVVVKNVKDSVFFTKIGSWVTLTQITARGRGGNPEVTKIPNRHYHYARTIAEMGDPDEFIPFEKGEAPIKKSPCCKKCGVITADFPQTVLSERENNGFISIIKECPVCGFTSESDFMTTKEEAYTGTINMIPAIERNKFKKKIATKKALNTIDRLIKEIDFELEKKKVTHYKYLTNYFIENGVARSREDGEYFSKILTMVKYNNKLDIEKKIKKYTR